MHEISNDGARDQFESLLSAVIVPAMIKCARVRTRLHSRVILVHIYFYIVFYYLRKEKENVIWWCYTKKMSLNGMKRTLQLWEKIKFKVRL